MKLKFIELPVIFMTQEEIETNKICPIENDDIVGEPTKAKFEINSICSYWPDNKNRTTMKIYNDAYTVDMNYIAFDEFIEKKVREHNERML